ncbi:homeobox protein 2 isoform X2 [Manduca sexta]|uniref:YLP motif-containing protein 1 n=1 Tax=Manduca sexta TaxID=7130 RepID=A0A921YKU4_MANSE|nr:homeobox protein 2 isoform X2 [Manduca sexta]KAG6440995.1 hypothetical protein O3G_MSEX001540 [Manduca sexta]
MSWGMPSTGQWSASMGMAPDMGMGSLTPEQWAAIQQQNWQQWAQWHQQYAQWQSQYGEKYTEQMQALQGVGKFPPLPPTAAPPPAPPAPPPEQPPPPPHENNQPLFGKMGGKGNNQPPTPTPVPAPYQNQQKASVNFNNAPNINQNRPYQSDVNKETPNVNADALKKLAEEEKLFDIQFEKWEQEIEKWRKENVNHPDKQAYKEYEQKFETCRAQLMERRCQMKLKRAKLLGNGPPAQPQASSSNSGSMPKNNISQHNYDQNVKPSHYQNQHQQIQKYAPENNSSQIQKYAPENNSSFQNHPHVNQLNYNRNKNIDPQDRYESYANMEDNVSNYGLHDVPPPPAQNDTSEFLSKGSSAKGIPGLDLVLETDKNPAKVMNDVIDISNEQPEIVNQPPDVQAPDYSTISKGINNILGDEKIMNILSMVHANNATNIPPHVVGNQISQQPNDSYNSKDNNFMQNQHQDRYQNNYNNQQQHNRHLPYDRQNQNYPAQQNQDNYNNQQISHRQNASSNRQDQNYPDQQNDFNPKYPPPKINYDERQPNTNQDQYYNKNFQPNVPPPVFESSHTRPSPGPLMQPNIQINRIPALLDLPGPRSSGNIPRDPPESNISRQPLQGNTHTSVKHPSPHPKWVEEPLFTPSIIVEYEHKPLRLKARDFIEPVHMFDYNHKSKNEDGQKRDFEKEGDELFVRKSKRDRDEDYVNPQKYRADYYNRDFERRAHKEDIRNELRSRPSLREDFERRRLDDRFDVRRRDDRDRYMRRDDFRDSRDYRDDRERERDRDRDRDRFRDSRRDNRNRSRSRDRDTRKRGYSREGSSNHTSKKFKETDNSQAEKNFQTKHVVMIDDILELPGRQIRPEKIVIIIRGPPGSGKSYLAKLIRDKEAEHGGTARIMSIDDYFMQEGEIEEKDPTTGRKVTKPTLKYEYDKNLEDAYLTSLKRAFKRTLTDGYFSFLIFDAVNDQLKHYADVWNNARQNGFQVYICTMELDPNTCFKRNIHNRSLEDIQEICSNFFPTPTHHIQLDATTLLQNAAIPDVTMEDVADEVVMEDAEEPEVESIFTSKWEKMDDAAQLARLDGTSKPLRPSQISMDDYLQIDDWTPNQAKPGKKSVFKLIRTKRVVNTADTVTYSTLFIYDIEESNSTDIKLLRHR